MFPTYLSARLVTIEVLLHPLHLYNDEYEWVAMIQCVVQYLPNLRNLLLTTHMAYNSGFLSHKKPRQQDKDKWWSNTGKVLLRLGAFIVLRHVNLQKLWMLPHRLCTCCRQWNQPPGDKILRLHLSTKEVTRETLTVKADHPAQASPSLRLLRACTDRQ